MSIIQTIRDKAAPLVIVLIGIALVGFIAMDAFVGKSSGLFGESKSIGSINGKAIDNSDLNAPNDYADAMAKAVGSRPVEDDQRVGNNDQQWRIASYYEAVKIETDKLGIVVTDAELNDAIKNPMQPPQFIQAIFGDPKQNPQYASQLADFCKNRYKTLNSFIKNQEDGYKKKGYKLDGKNDPEELTAMRRAFSPALFEAANIEPLRKTLLLQKYLTIMSKSTFVPTWVAEAINSQTAQMVNMQYVYSPYATIADSTLEKITDSDIEKYIGLHKDLFLQEANKQVSYVTFNAEANAADTTALLAKMQAKRADFATTTDPAIFLAQAGSMEQYTDAFKTKTQWGYNKFDSMAAKGIGAIGGPYIESGSFVMTKIIATTSVPDSVKARHILLKLEQGQDTMPVKLLADSLLTQINKGGNFDTLAKQYSVDGSKDKGGDLGFFGKGTMVKEFDNFCFFGKVGEKKIVKTQFGYHVIEITANKGTSTAYKMAVYAQPIRPSENTVNMALNEANKFSSAYKTTQTFNDAAKNSNGKINKLEAILKPGENKLNNIPNSQALLRDFINKAKVGEVSNPIKVGEKYFVCNLIATNSTGTQNATTARKDVERVLLDRKKAAKLIDKAKGATTLDDAATKLGVSVAKADSVMYANAYIAPVGPEPTVVGAAFDKNNMNKLSAPIAGNAGVFFIQPNGLATKAVSGSVQDTRKGLENEANQNSMKLLEELKRKIKIVDNRSKFQ